MTTPSPFAPARLGPIEVRNRIIKAATFENLSLDGQVTDALIDYHRAPAAGGVGMTTVAYLSVAPEGRTFRHQIVLVPEAVDGLRRLTDAVHAAGAAACAQIGHAGWFANPAESRLPAVGPSRLPNPHTFKLTGRLYPHDLERLVRDFERAGAVAVEAGFDAIEVHLGHGYLLSQFLSPFTNRRRDRWGGNLENRARFPRLAVRAVREGAGNDVAVTAKLNMYDGFRNGLEVEESVQVARWLAQDGALDALELTAGFTGRTPMELLRGEPLLPRLASQEQHPVRRVALKGASLVMNEDKPFEEAFLRPHARRFLDVGLPIVLLGGITRRETIEDALDEGFAFVAMARALLHDPDLVDRMQAGEVDGSGCVPCNECIIEMEVHGARCTRNGRPSPARPVAAT